MLEIIIPVLNEEKILREKKDYYLWLKNQARVIFVDGGSLDQTVVIAQKYGELISSKAGRAFQKNIGASHTIEEDILFLHVDACIDERAIDEVHHTLNKGVGAGCFTMKIEDPRPIFRLYENIVNWRAKIFGVIDGDLGLFVKKSLFERIGRFNELPIMEDLIIGKKLRKVCKIKSLPNKILVSSRRWDEEGFGRTFFRYMLAYIQLWTAIPFYKEPQIEST